MKIRGRKGGRQVIVVHTGWAVHVLQWSLQNYDNL